MGVCVLCMGSLHYCPLCVCSNLKGSDANGFVQKALDASNVYNNIVQYIDDANITGLTTYNLSRQAEDVSYPSVPADLLSLSTVQT